MGDRKATGWLEVILMTLLVAAATLVAAGTPLGQIVHPDDSAHLEQAATREALARASTPHLDILPALPFVDTTRGVTSVGGPSQAPAMGTSRETVKSGNGDLRQILLPAAALPRPSSEPEMGAGEARPNASRYTPVPGCNGVCRRTFTIPTPGDASPGP